VILRSFAAKLAMAKHDESLEIGLAAGLDIPTAMVISERNDDDEPPRRPTGRGCNRIVAIAVLAGIVMMVLCYLLR
jgi:hypothetical protein